MFAELLISIIFRLLNFAALIGLFIYIYKKYLQNDIEASIEHDRLAEINLNTRIDEMQQRSSELSEEIIKQEKLCTYLNERTAQWKVAFEKDMKERQAEQQAIHKQTVNRAHQQIKTIEYERMAQAILPKALERARNQLKKSFDQKAHGKAFVGDILSHMKKSL